MTMSPDTSTTSTRPGRSRRALIVGLVLAAIALAAAVVWYTGREAPAAVDTQAAIDAANVEAAADDTEASDAQPDADADTDSSPTSGDEEVPAAWQVVTDAVEYDLIAGTGTFIGFRIAEELTTVGDTEAVGRTPQVEGTVTLDGTTLVAATIVGDLTALTTDIRQRDGATQRALNTGVHPTTTFTLTEAVDLGTTPVVGEAISVEAVGELTLNGVTQPVTVALDAVLLDGVAGLLVTGSFPLTLADHDLTAPSAPIVVSVADTATIELQLYLDPA
ncbi:MAG: YceI family protein [Nitriliruptoraceae bacterium]